MLYFDHSATTPPHPQVIKKMNEISELNYGNPSSLYSSGRKAKAIIETARRIIAQAIEASPGEIFFTGSGTEANNMVIWSIIYGKKKHIITSSIEHPAILNVIEQLKPFGVSCSILPVNSDGQVNPKDLESSIRHDTGLISIMLVNNEVGTIQPIKKLTEIAQKADIPFHSDSVQALGKIPISVNDIGAQFLSFSGHKFYGPKGVGFLYRERKTKLNSLIIGGSQEENKRAGTENVSGIAGLGEAVSLISKNLDKRIKHLSELEALFKIKIRELNSSIIYNGDPKNHVPGLISISFLGNRSDILLAKLDRKGIELSNGSACGSGIAKPSPVLKAMGINDEDNLSTLRISFGRNNTKGDINQLVKEIGLIIND